MTESTYSRSGFSSFTAFSCSRIAGQRRDDAVMLKNPMTEAYPPSRTIDSVNVFTSVTSFDTCAVASTGLRGAQNGTSARSFCCASTGISGIAKPKAFRDVADQHARAA